MNSPAATMTSNSYDKLDFVTRQLKNTLSKRFENYVLTRIWHLLDDLDLKPVTQQYVARPNGRALTDLFFPQLALHIEVDEPHHLNQVEQDQLREADIINATNHQILRVDTSKGIDALHQRIDEVVAYIRQLKHSKTDFKPWSPAAEASTQTYLERGYIDLEDDVAFKRIIDAANCFGHAYTHWQRGSVKHPYQDKTIVWFPKLFANEDWDNRISDDEQTIHEKNIDPIKAQEHIEKTLHEGVYTRIIFAKVKDTLGQTRYRFKGEYTLNLNETNADNGLVWNRQATRVHTYAAKP